MAHESSIQPLVVLAGAPQTTQVTLTIISLNSGDVTLTIAGASGSPFTVTMTAKGTSGAPGGGVNQACFIGSQVVSSLTAFTQYSYTVTQGSDSASGTFYTAPEATDDFTLFYGTCDRFSLGAIEWTSWEIMSDYINSGSLPVIGFCITDDFGYVDGITFDDSAYTGHVVTNMGSSKTEYDHYAAWCCVFGMMGDTTETAIAFGRNLHRVHVLRNTNLFINWGNHDINGWSGNKVGTFEFDIDGVVADGQFHATVGGYDGPARNAWMGIFGNLLGTSAQSADTTSNHWYVDLGCVRLLTTDNISHNTTAPQVFGTNQIEDCLTALNSNHEFKIVTLNHSPAEPTDIGLTAGLSGILSHYPIYDNSLAEYKRFFTDDTSSPQSIMLNSKTNGQEGTTICFIGDHHRGMVAKYHQPSDTGVLPAFFYAINTATMNASPKHSQSITGVDGDDITVGDSTYDYYQNGTGKNNNIKLEYIENYSLSGYRNHIIKAEVYGSNSPKEIQVRLVNGTGTDETNVWEGRFIHKYGANAAIDVNKQIARQSAHIGDE